MRVYKPKKIELDSEKESVVSSFVDLGGDKTAKSILDTNVIADYYISPSGDEEKNSLENGQKEEKLIEKSKFGGEFFGE